MTSRSANRWLIGLVALLVAALGTSFFVDLYPTLRPQRADAGKEQYAWTAGALGTDTPYSEYRQVIRSRTLFSPSQGAMEPAEQRTIIDDYELMATFGRDEKARAVLSNVGTKRTRTVKKGDWIGDYEVIEIGPRKVVFDKAGRRVEL